MIRDVRERLRIAMAFFLMTVGAYISNRNSLLPEHQTYSVTVGSLELYLGHQKRDGSNYPRLFFGLPRFRKGGSLSRDSVARVHPSLPYGRLW